LTGGTALVVEDEPAVRDVTTRMLERAGYEVVAVGSGAEALAAASVGKPIDVLVTDAVMHGMSGIELADRMHDLYPESAVVILSGYTAETLDLERVIAQGARFVAKPISSGALLAAVGAAIDDRKLIGKQP
jgi:CheY-like chemotaxis protein